MPVTPAAVFASGRLRLASAGVGFKAFQRRQCASRSRSRHSRQGFGAVRLQGSRRRRQHRFRCGLPRLGIKVGPSRSSDERWRGNRMVSSALRPAPAQCGRRESVVLRHAADTVFSPSPPCAARSGRQPVLSHRVSTLWVQCSASQAASTRCGLTPHSSRAPTAKHQGRATVQFIICSAALAFSCRCRLSSNVRRRDGNRVVP
jgi:hypothetical protein